MKAWGLGNLFSSIAVPVGLQKRLISFLLQRAIGHFLEDDLDLDKLDIENGTVHLTDLKLNTRALNDIAAGTPLEVKQGRIGSITVTIPWKNLWSGQCILSVDGIDITLAPTHIHSNTSNDLEDQILSASMDLANDFLHRARGKEEAELQESLLQTFQSHTSHTPSGMPGDFNYKPANKTSTQNQPTSPQTSSPTDDSSSNQPSDGEGVQFVATLIEKLMARIQISCKRTIIRLKHSSDLPLVRTQIPVIEKLDYELEIHLPSIAYKDETPGWDQTTGGIDASNAGLSSSQSSASSSIVLEDSVMPSVIWQNSPESIKTVVFKGFSIWIRQQGKSTCLVSQDNTSQQDVSSSKDQQFDDQDSSDSDTDVFSDAQEVITQSMMASQIVPPKSVMSTNNQPTSVILQQKSACLYEAEILSTLQHRNKIKINMRRNATLTSGSLSTQTQVTVKSLLDVDFHFKSIFIALSPNQIAFIMEILDLMGGESKDNYQDNQRKPVEARNNTDPTVNLAGNNEKANAEEDPMNYGMHLRTDSFGERNLHAHSSTPISPKRSQSVDPLKLPRSPGGKPTILEKYIESRNYHGVPQASAVHLDSSKFLSGSTASPSSSKSSSSLVPSLTVKTKARVGTFQIYVLCQDPESQKDVPTEAGFYTNPTPQALRSGHLKLELDSMVLKFQKWRTIGSASNGQKKSSSQIDFTLSNFTVSEWIHSAPKPFDNSSWSLPSDRYRVPPRRQYIPIIEFDTDQDSLIKTLPTSKFPVLQTPDRYLSERSLLLRSKKSKRRPEPAKEPLIPEIGRSDSKEGTHSATTKEVVRMRVFLGSKKDQQSGSPLEPTSASSSSSHSPDIAIEVKPMQIHLDLFTFERLEKCLLAVTSGGRAAPTESDTDQKSKHSEQPRDNQDVAQNALKVRSRLRLRFNSIQIWVSIPDMAQILAGKKDSGPEYRSIYDTISINISKLVITHVLDSSKPVSTGREGLDAKHGRSEDQTPLAKIDLASISAFVVPAHETTSKAILFVGSLTNHPSSHSGFGSNVPTIEVFSHSPKSITALREFSSTSEFSQIPGLRAFAILDGEENVHNTVDEEEELINFKQQATDSSLLVLNAHIPLVAVHLEKRILDILQLRINDLSTWTAIFSEKLASLTPQPLPVIVTDAGFRDKPRRQRTESFDFKEDMRRSLDEQNIDSLRDSMNGVYRDDQSDNGTDQSTAYGEELRNQAEGLGDAGNRSQFLRDAQRKLKVILPTKVSVNLAAQNVEVTLDYPTGPTILDPVPIVKSYQINVGDAKVFAAAKYKGSNETYVCIDAEDLEFWEITAQPKTLLLTRMIPKNIKLKTPRPMVHMTSVLSFDPVRKYKENNTNLAFSGISWKFSIDQTAVDDVQDFFAEPSGIIYYNPPGQCTRIGVSLNECCMDYKPLHIPSRFVLTFERMKVFSTLIPESPTLKSKVQIYNMSLHLIDQVHSILHPSLPDVNSHGSGIEAKQFWRSLGYATIGQCSFFELRSVKSKTGQLPLYDLLITNQVFYLETCSDSFETLAQLAAYLGDNGDMPIEKKKILERLAEAEKAANRAYSNVIYQDVLAASLDEDAFRRPKLDHEQENPNTLDFTEGFYSIEKDDSESDMFKGNVNDTLDIDGFQEISADPADYQHIQYDHDSTRYQSRGKGSKIKARSQSSLATKSNAGYDSLLQSPVKSAQAKLNRGSTLDDLRKDDHSRSSSHVRKDSQLDDMFRVLDPDAVFSITENYFSIPEMTEEERAMDEGSLAKLRLRVRNFGFSWKLYDGLDWELSRTDEVERKRQARQLANRLYDPNDAIHVAMDSAQSNLEASIFERISGVQGSPADRHDGSYRRDLSPTSSEADSTCDYQADVMSQFSGAGGRTATSHSRRPTVHQQHQRQHSIGHQHDHKRKKKLERSKAALIEFNAEKIRLDFEDYIPEIEKASHLSLRVRQFEIIDNVHTSLWRKFLSHQRNEAHSATPRSSRSNMIRVDLDGVRPVVKATTVEYRLSIQMLPLRLYVDQDALVFLIKFFVQSMSKNNTTSNDEPLPVGMKAMPHEEEKKKPNELYFQSVRMGEISVKVDYKPKHVDYTGLSGGNFVELMNFFHLDAAEMTLQEVRLHGINGVTKLSQELISAWLPHIRSTQVPHMVSGLTPIRSLVNLGSGIADLVLLPIEQYKRDGHIIRGIQKGGQAFTKATTLEALKIGTKLAVGTQVLLEHADEIFRTGKANPESSSTDIEDPDNGDGRRVIATMVSDHEAFMEESIDGDDQLLQHLYAQQQQQQQQQLLQQRMGLQAQVSSSSDRKISKYANQPADLNEGMELAYKSLSKNIGAAAHTIFAVPMEVYEQTGAQGSVRAVIRAVPVAVLKPMIGATEAFSKVLIGIRNSIDPDQRLLNEDKYKN